jgi:hypothetical protein
MRKNLYWIIVLLVSCMQEGALDVNKTKASSANPSTKSHPSSRIVGSACVSDAWDGNMTASCQVNTTCTTTTSTSSSPNSGSYGGNGYYRYAAISLNVTAGCSVNYLLHDDDVPNQFTIYGPSGNFLYTSGWIYSSTPNYSGPWSNGNGTMVSSWSGAFTASASGTYTLVVETVTNTSNGGLTDSWDGGMTATCQQTVPCTKTVITTTSPTSGYYGNAGYYKYPIIYLNVTAGCTINYLFHDDDVPNRFTIYSPSGAFVATSGWIYSTTPNYSGPWDGGNGTMVSSWSGGFTATATGNYSLIVETDTDSSTDPNCQGNL